MSAAVSEMTPITGIHPRKAPWVVPTELRSASFSGANCVAVSLVNFRGSRHDASAPQSDPMVCVRNSTQNGQGADQPLVFCSTEDWGQLIADIQAGLFDTVQPLFGEQLMIGHDICITGAVGGGFSMSTRLDRRATPQLSFTRGERSAFLAGVAEGEFDLERLFRELDAANTVGSST